MTLPSLYAPASVDLELYRGARLTRSWSWQHDGVTQPLDGYSARAQVRTHADGPLVQDLTAYLSVDHATNVISLDVPGTVTKTWLSGVWDLVLYDPLDASSDFPLMTGVVSVQKGPTQ